MPRSEPLARRWQVEPRPDQALADALARGLSVPSSFARLLAQRGCTTVESARHFLRPSRADLHDPLLLPDMDRAVERLVEAIRRGEAILVHGDYDVDGQCSTAIMTRLLTLAGGRPIPFVPHRLRDGYDLSDAGVRAAAAAGARVILTLDCGTTAVAAVAAARGLGADVIVADHHLPGPVLPDVVALVNPRRSDSRYPFAELCGAGVAWKLAQALARAVGLGEAVPWHFLDLVALATVADLAPLVGENRVLVRLGLKLLRGTRWPGLAAMIETAGLRTTPLRASHLAFILGPRLNAAGRVGDAADGLRLLLTDDPCEAAALATRLEHQNVERQAIDQRTLREALSELETRFDPARDVGVVLAREGWHPGVIGIVASRVVDQIARPTVLVALDGAIGKGSGRSVARCDLHLALARCAPHLDQWGGHRMAAGLTVRRERLAAFREAFNLACAAQVAPQDLEPVHRVDAILALADLSDDFERLLRALEPTGMGNPGPVFGLQGVVPQGPLSAMGENHVRFTLGDRTGATLRVAGFGLREAVETLLGGARGPLRVAVRLERDTYRGRDQLEGRLVGLAPE